MLTYYEVFMIVACVTTGILVVMSNEVWLPVLLRPPAPPAAACQASRKNVWQISG